MSDGLEARNPKLTQKLALVNTNTRERWELSEQSVLTVGRADDNNLWLKDDVYASGHHAQIVIADGICQVKDLESRNGTYKNNEPVIGSVPVEKGDLITFGRTKFEIE